MPDLQLVVDLRSAVPPFEQIRGQVAGHVATGALRPGDRLPTVRALAADLGIAPGTVARAYRELEAAGVVTTRRRAGTVVAAGAPAPEAGHVAAAAAELARRAAGARLGETEVLDLVRAALREQAPTP